MTTSNPTGQLKQSGKQTGTFHFKQFSVEDNRSTMKVGTDAVLLGAVANAEGVDVILEIGAGCGIVSLIMAQRSGATIDAVEIDHDSAEQARSNADRSPWAEKINIIHDSIQNYSVMASIRYDLIISNPPFFNCSLKSPDKKRNLSRHNDSMSYKDLLAAAVRLMKEEASFWVILPSPEFDNFNQIANAASLHLQRKINIISKEGRKEHRVIMQFRKNVADPVTEKAITILDQSGKYTSDYKNLTQDFYLDF